MCGDAFTDFAHALEAITPPILSDPDLPTVRVILQSDDIEYFNGLALEDLLKKLNKDSGYKLFRKVKVVNYDTNKEFLKNDFQIQAGYKTILVAGWKPTKDPLGKHWTPSPELFHQETFDKTVRNYFGDFESTPKDKSAILTLLVLLSTKENSLDTKLQHDTLTHKLKQSFNDRSQEDLFGTITLASAIFKDKKFSDLTLYSVDPTGKTQAKKLDTTLQDWLKQPLVPAKEIPQKISKEKIEKPALTQWEIKKQTEEQEALKKKENWLKGFEEAKKFTYTKKPKLRLIVTSDPSGHNAEAINIVTGYLNKHKNLFDGPIETVDYRAQPPLSDLRDGIYKNIFVVGRGDTNSSYVFLRSDGAFSAYQDATDFSPNSTLLLIVSLSQKTKEDLETIIFWNLGSYHYTNSGMIDSSGGKYVVIGQSTPLKNYSTPFIVFKRDGSFSTVADWLTWGVDLSGKKPPQKQEIKKLKQKKESTTQLLKEPKEQPKPSMSSKKLSPEEQTKIDWEKGLEKALAFKYKKTPQVRIIISTELKQAEDQKTVKEEITKFLKKTKLVDLKNIVFVNYDETHDQINLLDGTYKNIFLIGLNGQSSNSQFFFREVYFGAEKHKPANEFSPITTLLLIMPLNKKSMASYFMLKACYSYDLIQDMSGPLWTKSTVCGDKYVAVGQTEPFSQAPTIDEPVLKPDGSITTLEDWLTWGVPLKK